MRALTFVSLMPLFVTVFSYAGSELRFKCPSESKATFGAPVAFSHDHSVVAFACGSSVRAVRFPDLKQVDIKVPSSYKNWALQVSPTGDHVLIIGGFRCPQILDLNTGQTDPVSEDPAVCESLAWSDGPAAFSNDGSKVAMGFDSRSKIYLLDIGTRLSSTIQFGSSNEKVKLNHVVFSKDDSMLLAGGVTTDVALQVEMSYAKLIKFRSGRSLEFRGTGADIPNQTSGPVISTAISPDNRRVALAHYQKNITVIDLKTGKETKVQMDRERSDFLVGAVGVDFSRDSKALYSGWTSKNQYIPWGNVGEVIKTTIATGASQTLVEHDANFCSFSISKRQDRVFTGSCGGNWSFARATDIKTKKEFAISSYDGHVLLGAAMSEDGKMLAAVYDSFLVVKPVEIEGITP